MVEKIPNTHFAEQHTVCAVMHKGHDTHPQVAHSHIHQPADLRAGGVPGHIPTANEEAIKEGDLQVIVPVGADTIRVTRSGKPYRVVLWDPCALPSLCTLHIPACILIPSPRFLVLRPPHDLPLPGQRLSCKKSRAPCFRREHQQAEEKEVGDEIPLHMKPRNTRSRPPSKTRAPKGQKGEDHLCISLNSARRLLG